MLCLEYLIISYVHFTFHYMNQKQSQTGRDSGDAE